MIVQEVNHDARIIPLGAQALDQRQGIDLTQGLPHGVTLKSVSDDAVDLLRMQGNTCKYFHCDGLDSVIAIHKGRQE